MSNKYYYKHRSEIQKRNEENQLMGELLTDPVSLANLLNDVLRRTENHIVDKRANDYLANEVKQKGYV